MKIFKVGDIVRELEEFTLGEVTKIDYDCGFDEVWVTFDDHLTDHCYSSKELRLVCPAYQRFDKEEHPSDFDRHIPTNELIDKIALRFVDEAKRVFNLK
ncbi:hypothetical protein [Robertmurraya siralis]|uniref:hypothetical protein n=1 Tax=Robertmurraya siralis TaxID=77777 RepID=UPI0010F5F65B|nr:hypothetical protein [Robertmurraya siralis]